MQAMGIHGQDGTAHRGAGWLSYRLMKNKNPQSILEILTFLGTVRGAKEKRPGMPPPRAPPRLPAREDAVVLVPATSSL